MKFDHKFRADTWINFNQTGAQTWLQEGPETPEEEADTKFKLSFLTNEFKSGIVCPATKPKGLFEEKKALFEEKEASILRFLLWIFKEKKSRLCTPRSVHGQINESVSLFNSEDTLFCQFYKLKDMQFNSQLYIVYCLFMYKHSNQI